MATRPAEGGSGYRLEPTRIGNDRATGVARRFVTAAVVAVVAAIALVGLWPEATSPVVDPARPPSAVAVGPSQAAPTEAPPDRGRGPLPTRMPQLLGRAAEPESVLYLDRGNDLRILHLDTGTTRPVAEAEAITGVNEDGSIVTMRRREPWSRTDHRLELEFTRVTGPGHPPGIWGATEVTPAVVLEGVRPRATRRSFRAVSAASVVDPGGAWVAVASVARGADEVWEVAVEVLPFSVGARGGRMVLGRFDDVPEAADQTIAIDVRADGRALVVATENGFAPDPGEDRGRAWVVLMADGAPFRSAAIALRALEPGLSCQGLGFVTPERVVERCVGGPVGAPDSLLFIPYDLGGYAFPPVVVDGFPGARRAAYLADEKAGVLYAWDSVGPSLARVDPRSGGFRRSTDAPDLDPLVWQNQPIVDRERAAVLSGDGRRLYAVGGRIDERRRISSTGIWTFDTGDLEVVGHWELPTLPVSLTLTAGGRYLLATSLPGITADGELAEFEASVAVFDLETGERVSILGQLGQSRNIRLLPQPAGG